MVRKSQERDRNSLDLFVVMLLVLVFLIPISTASYAVTKTPDTLKPVEIYPTKYVMINGRKAKVERIVKTELNLKNEPGTFNAGVAARILNKNGSVLKSGETFSYNKRVGERTKEKGYKKGTMPITKNGKKIIIKADGSGVCRLAVVLNTNAERMGLQSVARKAHEYKPGYFDYDSNKKTGLKDATVYWPNIDLKFRNTKKYDIYIESGLRDHRVLWSSFFRVTWQ